MAAAELTEEDVRAIDKALRDGVSGAQLAREFLVSQQSVSAINTGLAWGHVTGRELEISPTQQLTVENVLYIDARLRDGVRGNIIAAEFGVSKSIVSAIKRGRNWGWVTGREQAPPKFTRSTK